MAEQEMPKSGTFCWNELATRDAVAAKKFYADLLGWQIEGSQAAGMEYNEIVVAGEHIGGIYQMMPEQGDAPSHWMTYIAVDDVDAKAEQATQLGGKDCVPPTEIPTVGRLCVITDPTGASIAKIYLSGPPA